MAKEEKFNYLKDTSESKQQQAYAQIKEDILNNTYPPGTVLVERKLCDIYNVSRSPIRNALWQLTYEGLLTYEPGKGAAVAGFSIEDILEVYDLIEVLQLYAVRSLLVHPQDYAIHGLGSCLSSMKESLDLGDTKASNRWDYKFHQLLIEASPNKRLKAMYAQLSLQSQRFIATILEDAKLSRRSYEEHRAILEAIKAQDIAAVTQQIKEHYENIRQYYVTKLLERV